MKDERFRVLVPRLGTAAFRHIDSGSGIVCAATPPPSETIVVYYEGNRYHSQSLMTFEGRVALAADRLRVVYPTIARGVYPWKDFVVVGEYRLSADGPPVLDVFAPLLVDKWTRGTLTAAHYTDHALPDATYRDGSGHLKPRKHGPKQYKSGAPGLSGRARLERRLNGLITAAHRLHRKAGITPDGQWAEALAAALAAFHKAQR